MQLFRRTSGGETKESPLRQAGGDAVQVLIDYVKQETLDPVKGLGRFVAMGVAGSLLLALGLLLLLIALLRALADRDRHHLHGQPLVGALWLRGRRWPWWGWRWPPGESPAEAGARHSPARPSKEVRDGSGNQWPPDHPPRPGVRLRQGLGEGEETAHQAIPQMAVVVGAVAIAALTMAFLAGRRRGRRRASRIEIRQF